MDEVQRLPKRMREVVILRALLPRYQDVADVLGVHTSRVGYLIKSVDTTLREMSEKRVERERPVASPRAARLRELEDEPPDWLIETIGRPPTRNANASSSILAWRRAALAIDDYRNDYAWASKQEALGPKPTHDLSARRAYDRAQRAVAQLSEARQRQRGITPER